MILLKFTVKGICWACFDVLSIPSKNVKSILIAHVYGDLARWGHKIYFFSIRGSAFNLAIIYTEKIFNYHLIKAALTN